MWPRHDRRGHETVLLSVCRHNPRLEKEEVGIARVDPRLDPMRVPRAEGLHAGEIREHAVGGAVDRLVDLEIVAVAVHQHDLAFKPQRLLTQRVDVVGERIPRPGIGQVLLVVEVRVRLPDRS